MAETLAITLPDDAQSRDMVLQTLNEMGCLSPEQASANLMKKAPEPKGNWASVVQKIAQAAAFEGELGDHLLAASEELRSGFELRHADAGLGY